ncbi:hypothetical protein LXL04_022621 [Taraxacum kok-saghyz]
MDILMNPAKTSFSAYVEYIFILLCFIQDTFLSVLCLIGISKPIEFHHLHHPKKPENSPISAVLTREFLVTSKCKDVLGNNSSKDCAICLDEFKGEDEIRCLTNCKHMFHLNCLDRWMDQIQDTCPLCRIPILPLACQDEYKERLRCVTNLNNSYRQDFVILVVWFNWKKLALKTSNEKSITDIEDEIHFFNSRFEDLRGCLIHHGLGLGLRPRTTDHGPSPTSQSPIKRLGPRTESDIRGNFFSLQFFWADRVRGKRSDRVRGPSPSSAIKRTDHGPSPWSEFESLVRDLCKQHLSKIIVINS